VSKRVQLRRTPVAVEQTVYRVVKTSSLDPRDLACEFISDREAGKEAETDREEKYPELLDGVSVWKSRAQAAERWREMQRHHGDPEQGSYIAEIVLSPDAGFDIEDRKRRDGKLTIWGEPAKLAVAVCRNTPAVADRMEEDVNA
jgi:hypothetical protein